MKIVADVEIRESKGGKRLELTLIQEGRAAAGGRRELFTLGSISWPDEGVAIRSVHLGPAIGRAHPARRPDGRIQISTKANAAMVKAVEVEGKRGASVEFVPIRQTTTQGGVTEVRRAFVDGVALVVNPEYSQGRAEIRSRRKGNILWRL